jgi:CheY-like chemotaxis protein
VGSKTTEPAPTTGWTPPAPGSPATWTPPAAGTPAAWTPSASAAAVTPAAPPDTAQQAPAVEETPVAEEPSIEAESLPLRFGPEVEPESEKESEAQRESSAPLRFGPEVEAEPEASWHPAVAQDPEPEPEPIVAEAPEAEPEPEPEPEPKRDARGSMRSMLFGEEAVSAPEPEPATEPAPSEPEPVAAEQAWQEQASTPEPVTPVAASDPWRPWNPAPEPEQAEVVATTERDEAPAAGVPAKPSADDGDGPNAGTVVIIEDDAAAATYYATLFRGNGYHVEVANDGVSGVDLCTRLQPQLIMLDVMMPRQNGILVLQTLRASDETKNTPVVVMSNFSEPTLIKRAIQLGALEYVIKTQVEGPALLNALPRWMNHEKAFAAA